jgi:hypothetical protein
MDAVLTFETSKNFYETTRHSIIEGSFKLKIPVRFYTNLLPYGAHAQADHVGFVLDKIVLGQIFSEFFAFPPSVSIHRGSIFTNIFRGLDNRPVTGPSSIDIVKPHHNYNSNCFWVVLTTQKKFAKLPKQKRVVVSINKCGLHKEAGLHSKY